MQAWTTATGSSCAFFAQGRAVFDFLDRDMVAGQRSQRLGRIGELHDMAGLRLEIDDDTFVGGVPILDLAEAPTPVGAISSGGKLLQLFREGG